MPRKVPAVWVERRKSPSGWKYRVVWREVLFDEARRAYNGQRQFEPFVFSRNLAEKKKQDKIEELEAVVMGQKPKAPRRRWHEIAEPYLKHCALHNAAWARFDKPAVEKFGQFIGNPIAEDIDGERILDYEQFLRTKGRSGDQEKPLGYAPNMVRMLLKDLRTCFNYAKKQGWISRAPYIRLPDAQSIDRVVPYSEMVALRNKVTSPVVARVVMFDAHTGLRLEEVTEVDYQHLRVALDEERDERYWELTVKNAKRKDDDPDRYRFVAVPHQVAAIIGLPAAASQDIGARPPQTGKAFVVNRQTIQRQVLVAVRKLKLPRTRFHDFRHTWATAYMEETGDLYGLMKAGGWKDIDSVMKYQHLTKGRRTANLRLRFHGAKHPSAPTPHAGGSSPS